MLVAPELGTVLEVGCHRWESRDRITSPNLLAKLPLMQPRIHLAFWARSACCQLMFNLSSTKTPKSSSSGLLSIYSLPSLYLCLGCPDPRAGPCSWSHWTRWVLHRPPSSLPRSLWMAFLPSSLSTTPHMLARNRQHLLSDKLTNIDNSDKNRKSNNKQHPETQLTSGKRGWCLFEKEMLQGMCGKKDKSSCGQRMPDDCPGSFSFPFISPQINCIPSFTKEWPPWQKKSSCN